MAKGTKCIDREPSTRFCAASPSPPPERHDPRLRARETRAIEGETKRNRKEIVERAGKGKEERGYKGIYATVVIPPFFLRESSVRVSNFLCTF